MTCWIHFVAPPPQLSVSRPAAGEDVIFACSVPAIKNTTCYLYVGDETIRSSSFSKESRVEKKWFHQFYVPVKDLLRLPPHQRLASCDYSLKDEANTSSPRSEQYNLAGKWNNTWQDKDIVASETDAHWQSLSHEELLSFRCYKALTTEMVTLFGE